MFETLVLGKWNCFVGGGVTLEVGFEVSKDLRHSLSVNLAIKMGAAGSPSTMPLLCHHGLEPSEITSTIKCFLL